MAKPINALIRASGRRSERRAKTIRVFAQAQIAHHLQLGEADVLAVDIGDQVTDPDERMSLRVTFLTMSGRSMLALGE
jgi:hypothetical protein